MYKFSAESHTTNKRNGICTLRLPNPVRDLSLIHIFSDSTHLVTRLNDGGITLTAGFCDSDWLFFDEVTISLEDQENITHSFDFYEVNREVINYGIKESVAYTPTSEEIEKFINSSNGIIRFKNSGDEKHLDFQLSTDEIQAVNTLFKIKKAERGLSIYLSWFNQK